MVMRKLDVERSEEVYFIEDLSDPNIDLDLTREPWNVPPGGATELLGVDVLREGGIRPDGGRSPVGVSLASGDRDATTAVGMDFQGRAVIRYTRNTGAYDAGLGDSGNEGLDYDDVGTLFSGNRFVIHDQTSGGGDTPFNNYTFAQGDRVIVFNPASHRGEYDVQSKIDNTGITIKESAGEGTVSGALDIKLYRDPSWLISDSHDVFVNETALMKSGKLYESEGPWDTEMINGFISFNEDRRTDLNLLQEFRQIISVTTTLKTNDTINWANAITAIPNSPQKIEITYEKFFDKSGIWVTNGRKFWLLQAGAFGLYLDLGSDTYKGLKWYPIRLTSNRVMFVNDKYPPRIVHLNSPIVTQATDESTYAGCLTPVKPQSVESQFQDEIPHSDIGDEDSTDRSWDMGEQTSSTNGVLINGTYRAKVRAINTIDSLESQFVDVYDSGNLTSKDLVISTATSPSTSGIRIKSGNSLAPSTNMPPPFSPRWTHIEVWRTPQNNKFDYRLESRIQVAGVFNEDSTGTNANIAIAGAVDEPIAVADAVVSTLPALTSDDLLSGRLPPICRRAVNLRGVTICMGRAASDAQDATFYSHFKHQVASATSYDVSLRTINSSTSNFDNYALVDGDLFEVTDGGTSGVPLGRYDIESRADGNIVLKATGVNGSDAPAGTDATLVEGHVLRPFVTQWPKVADDEEVSYSRTDKFAPESFQSRILRLSQIGDTFRNIVVVGDYAAVIMASGVHLLRLEAGSLVLDTIATQGEGTPWEDSVVRLDRRVLWATEDGPKVLSISNSPDDSGHRGRVSFLDKTGNIRQWFRDAYDNNERIDAGVDTLNRCVRWRRTIDNNTFQCLQFSYRTNKFTMLDDDNGIFYARTSYAEAKRQTSETLYSATKEGAIFKVNNTDNSDSLSQVTVQDILDDTYDMGVEHIRKPGDFSSDMLGMVVRFRSDNPDIDGVSRVITLADENRIDFDSVTGLAVGDEFIIGATRFRIKWAPIIGSDKRSIKTLEGAIVRALPGRRNETGGPWPEHLDSEGRLTMRVYRNYSRTADDTETKGIPIFQDGGEYESSERSVGVEASGTSLEIEIENLETRTDFRLELVEAEVRQDSDSTESRNDT